MKKDYSLMIDINGEIWISQWIDNILSTRTDFDVYRNFSCTEVVYVLNEGDVKLHTSLKEIEKTQKRLIKRHKKEYDTLSLEIKAELIIKK